MAEELGTDSDSALESGHPPQANQDEDERQYSGCEADRVGE